MRRQFGHLTLLVLLACTLTACTAGRAFRRGENQAQLGNWDAAVAYFRTAVQNAPGRPEYKIALERAMVNASRAHLDKAREFERQDQLDAALVEYRKASEYDPSNRQAAAKVLELERTIRDRIEATRPKPAITQLRERARQATPEPMLNPASREPLNLRFNNASLRDILNFIANATGINITFDRDYVDRAYTVQLEGVTLEQALSQILTANQLFYKVLNERTIIIVPDSPVKRAQYEEQVIRTFFISHSDAVELSQILSQIIRLPTMPVQPMIAANKTANTITIRASAPVAAIIEQIIERNDKPRAEVIVDVEILEVNRTRAKQYGLNLTQYALGGIFSPEVGPGAAPGASTTTGTTPGGTTTPGTTTGGTGGTSNPPESVASPPPFNLNTISQGVSTADFFLAVPAAIVRFLESDTQTKLIAKPQLRGSEGEKLTLNLGDEIPVPSTTYTPIAGGGATVNPLTSFTLKQVGVNLEITPRVTFEGDVILQLTVESSTLGAQINVAGTNLPSFGSRKVVTKLRLRDGESNLLAGLLREDERKSLRGFPGAIHVPILKQLMSDNDRSISQTDIVMLLTPRVVRTHELSQRDLSPIYIGTQQNLGLGGPPPLIAPQAGTEQGAAPELPGPAVIGMPGTTPSTAGTPVVPPDSSPIPGTTPPPSPPTAATPSAPAAPSPTPGTTTPTGPAPGTPTPPPTPLTPSPQPPPPPPATTPEATQILVTAPGTEFRVAGGPYTVPISITGAARVSTVTVTLTYNASVLRPRTVQEGSFMRQGGVTATLTQNVDAAIGRIDITITRLNDQIGASGSGLLAAVMFDAVAPGNVPFAVSGAATGPEGVSIPVTFRPATVVVK